MKGAREWFYCAVAMAALSFFSNNLPVCAGSEDSAAAQYRWRQSQGRVALVRDETVVWQLNFDRAQGKPNFHPLCLPDGTLLSWDRPADHPWHRAVWFSWKFINGVNYWAREGGADALIGRTEVQKVTVELKEDFSAWFAMRLVYRPGDGPAVLFEDRWLKISAPDDLGWYRIDWLSDFRAGDKDVMLDRTPIAGQKGGKPWGGYAGLSVRLAKELTDWQVVDSQGRRDLAAHGQRARWLDFSGRSKRGRLGGICVLDHPSNPRHPSPWFIAMDPKVPFGYFGPALLFYEPCRLLAKGQLRLFYRILVHPGRADAKSFETDFANFAQLSPAVFIRQWPTGRGDAGPATASGQDPAARLEQPSRVRQAVGGLSESRLILRQFQQSRRSQPAGRKRITVLGLDLTGAARLQRPAELTELFERQPGPNDSYRLRSEVLVARHRDHWSEAAIYYVPGSKRFYVVPEPGKPGPVSFFGPFAGDPFERLGVDRPKPAIHRHRFAIYLVADAIDCGRTDPIALDQLHLAAEPVLTEEDVLEYDWQSHSLRVKSSVRERIPAVGPWGVPFVVVADGQLCYLGALWSTRSSYLPRVPVCYIQQDLPGPLTELNLRIERPMGDTAADPRSDSRIRRVIGEARQPQPSEPARRRVPLARQLKTVVDISHWSRDTTFAEAVEDLRAAVDPPLKLIVLWRDLSQNAGIDRETAIQIDGVQDVTLSTALQLLLQAVASSPQQLGYVIEHDVITVGTKDSLHRNWRTQVYDISDLIR